MGVQNTTALREPSPTSYLAIEVPSELVVMTVEEYMKLPRSMLSNWLSMRLVVGEKALIELLQSECVP